MSFQETINKQQIEKYHQGESWTPYKRAHATLEERCKYYGYRNDLMGRNCVDPPNDMPGCGQKCVGSPTSNPLTRGSKTKRVHS